MNLSPLPIQKFFDNAGRPLNGGLLFTYVTGTSTKLATYIDASGGTPNTNPIVLDFRGEANVWLDPTLTYKFVLSPSTDTDPPTNPIWTVDNIAGGLTIVQLTRAFLGLILFPQTAAEAAASVTPINYYIPSHEACGIVLPLRYGAVGDLGTDDTTAIVHSFSVAGQAKAPVYIGGVSGYLCTSNINVQIGTGQTIDVIGSGWDNAGIKFSGASVTTGLTFTGSSYDYCGTIRDTRIQCASSAKRCVTFTNLNHPRIVRCHLHGAAGAGVIYDTTLMGLLEETLVTSCGSATEGSVEVFGDSTTWKWDHSRISGGNTTVGGLLIDKCYDVVMIGGAIESSGPPLKIGSKADAARGLIGGSIINVDFENPGNGNYYIDIGAGLTVTAKVTAWHITAAAGSLSGTANIGAAIRFNQALNVTISNTNWGVAGATAFFLLTSTTNLGIQIEPHRNLFGSSIPWVYVNGAQVVAAGPHLNWNSDSVPIGLNPATLPALSGATPSILISANQGGYYEEATMNNGGATIVTALTGGTRGMKIYLTATNGNTTLTHSVATADQFWLVAGVNLLMTAGQYYHFVHNGTLWVQI